MVARWRASTGAVFRDLHSIAVGLPVLGEQDKRGGVGGLRGEGQVEQDEGVGVPAHRGGRDVEGNPDRDDEGLDDEESGGAEESGNSLGHRPESIRVNVWQFQLRGGGRGAQRVASITTRGF